MHISPADVVRLVALAFLLVSCGPTPLGSNSGADGSDVTTGLDASSGSGGAPATSGSGGASGPVGTGSGGSGGSGGGAASNDAAGSEDAAGANDGGDIGIVKDSGLSTDAGACPEMRPSPVDVCPMFDQFCSYRGGRLTLPGSGDWVCRCGGIGTAMPPAGLLRWDCGPIL